MEWSLSIWQGACGVRNFLETSGVLQSDCRPMALQRVISIHAGRQMDKRPRYTWKKIGVFRDKTTASSQSKCRNRWAPITSVLCRVPNESKLSFHCRQLIRNCWAVCLVDMVIIWGPSVESYFPWGFARVYGNSRPIPPHKSTLMGTCEAHDSRDCTVPSHVSDRSK